MKHAGQQFLDAMNLGGNVLRRQSDDVADGFGAQVLQVQQDDLPIDRLELLDDRQQSLQRIAVIQCAERVVLVHWIRYVIERVHLAQALASLRDDVFGGGDAPRDTPRSATN